MKHSHSRAIRWSALTALLVAFPLGASAAESSGTPSPFTEAKITQVVNDVSVSPASDPTTKQVATQGMDFKAPDIISTGRRSRAQLTASDGTIARVGSNTVFSLDPSSRTIHLKEGSVLFNSPKGGGGGTIETGSATATVTGTTIIVSATPDGGFKLLVLEGTATMKLPNGQIVTVGAGQMTFVLPASKGGTAGPTVNFDLKKEAQSSALVNGFTVDLPSTNLIVDATNQQQVKIQSGQLTQTGQVVVGANDAKTITLATLTTVDSLPANNAVTYPDLVIGALGNTTTTSSMVSGNTTTTTTTFVDTTSAITGASNPTGVTMSASSLSLPSGILPNDSILITGIFGNNIQANGTVNLDTTNTRTTTQVGGNEPNTQFTTVANSLAGVQNLDVFAQGNLTFTVPINNDNIKSPGLASPGDGLGSSHGRKVPDNISSRTTFEVYSSTLNLNLIAEKGFVFEGGSSEVSARLNPINFGTQFYFDDLATPNLATPSINNPAPAFGTQFTMTSVLADFDTTNLYANNYSYPETGSIVIQAVVGNITGDEADIESSQDTTVRSILGGINLTNGFIYSGDNGNGDSKLNVLAGTGDILLDDTELETYYTNPYNGTVNVISPANVTIRDDSEIFSQNKNLIAGGTLTITSSEIDNDASMISGGKYVLGGDTVNLSDVNFAGCTNLTIYTLNGVINGNSSITVPGSLNLGESVTYNGDPLTSDNFGSSNIQIGLTSDNSSVQSALSTPLAITSCTTSFSSNLTFANVLFSPEQLGEPKTDAFFAQVHGLIAGAVTINGNGSVDFSSLDSVNGEGDLAGKSIAISGNVGIIPPDGADSLLVFSLGNIGFASDTSVFDASSSANMVYAAVHGISLDNASLSNSMGSELLLIAVTDGISLKNGASIMSGSSDGSNGNLTLQTYDDTASISISNSTLTTYRGPLTINSANISITDLSTLTANCNTLSLNGGATGISISNSTLSAGNMTGSLVNLYSNNNISITNNSTIASYTGTDVSTARILITAAHNVTVTNSVLQSTFTVINAHDSVNADTVSFAGTENQQINIQARTVNLSNINFPAGSQVNLTSELGLLAPNPNTGAQSVVGDVNFIRNVNYGGQPAQNSVSNSVGGTFNSDGPPINIRANSALHINSNR